MLHLSLDSFQRLFQGATVRRGFAAKCGAAVRTTTQLCSEAAAGAAWAALRATTLRPPLRSSCALWRALPAVMSGHSSAWPLLTGREAMHEVLLTCQSGGDYSRLNLLCHVWFCVCVCMRKAV